MEKRGNSQAVNQGGKTGIPVGDDRKCYVIGSKVFENFQHILVKTPGVGMFEAHIQVVEKGFKIFKLDEILKDFPYKILPPVTFFFISDAVDFVADQRRCFVPELLKRMFDCFRLNACAEEPSGI